MIKYFDIFVLASNTSLVFNLQNQLYLVRFNNSSLGIYNPKHFIFKSKYVEPIKSSRSINLLLIVFVPKNRPSIRSSDPSLFFCNLYKINDFVNLVTSPTASIRNGGE